MEFLFRGRFLIIPDRTFVFFKVIELKAILDSLIQALDCLLQVTKQQTLNKESYDLLPEVD